MYKDANFCLVICGLKVATYIKIIKKFQSGLGAVGNGLTYGVRSLSGWHGTEQTQNHTHVKHTNGFMSHNPRV